MTSIYDTKPILPPGVKTGYLKNVQHGQIEEFYFVNFEIVDEEQRKMATKAGLDVELLKSVTLKLRNVTSIHQDWESLVGKTVDLTSADVVMQIKNNRFIGYALAIDFSAFVTQFGG